MLDHGLARASEALEAAGANNLLSDKVRRNAGWHLLGTARMGDDPSNSVVDRWGRAHDVPNLMIIDGSIFTTGACINPTPTIQALALRTAGLPQGRGPGHHPLTKLQVRDNAPGAPRATILKASLPFKHRCPFYVSSVAPTLSSVAPTLSYVTPTLSSVAPTLSSVIPAPNPSFPRMRESYAPSVLKTWHFRSPTVTPVAPSSFPMPHRHSRTQPVIPAQAGIIRTFSTENLALPQPHRHSRCSTVIPAPNPSFPRRRESIRAEVKERVTVSE